MNNNDQTKGQAELTEAQKEAFKWLLQNDDFEYQEINGVDVPTLVSIANVMERYAALKSAPSIPIADFIKKWNVAFENKEQEAEFASEMFNDLVKLSNELKSNHAEEQPNNGLGVSAFDSTFNPEIKAKSEERETDQKYIKFIVWFTGHDEETIRQVFSDYSQNNP